MEASLEDSWRCQCLTLCSFFVIFPGQILKQLARTYADNHATMSNNDTDRCGASFYRTRGIINGALWYSFAGGKMTLPTKELFSRPPFPSKPGCIISCFFFKVAKNMSFQGCSRKFYSQWEQLSIYYLAFCIFILYILMYLVTYKY